MYFYQVQTQLHVIGLTWCDFCVWSPVGEPFVQRIEYDKEFIDKTLVKLRNFISKIFACSCTIFNHFFFWF